MKVIENPVMGPLASSEFTSNVVDKEETREYNCFYFKCSAHSSVLLRMSFETFCFWNHCFFTDESTPLSGFHQICFKY